jgi:hypothetical protein
MVGMAIYIVRRLEMSRSNKLKLSVLFAFGGLSVSSPANRTIAHAFLTNGLISVLGFWVLLE